MDIGFEILVAYAMEAFIECILTDRLDVRTQLFQNMLFVYFHSVTDFLKFKK